MNEFIEIFNKNLDMPNDISQTFDKYNKESFSTRSQIGQIALIQNEVFKQAINIKRETISDMDIEREQRAYKIQVLEDKIGLPDSKVIE